MENGASLRKRVSNLQQNDPGRRLSRWALKPLLDASSSKTCNQQACLMFADAQLILGASLMVVSASRLCSMSNYHTEVASSIAYCASVTYMCAEELAVPLLRREWSKAWRLFWLTSLLLMVIASRLMWHNQHYLQSLSVEMACVWEFVGTGHGYHPRNIAMMVLFITTEINWYINSFFLLYPQVLEWKAISWVFEILSRYLRIPMCGFIQVHKERKLQTHKDGITVLIRQKALFLFEIFLWISAIIALSLKEFFTSTLVTIVINAAYLLVLSIGIGPFRRRAAIYMEESEDEWSFGQTMPVVLLVVPLTALVETLYCKHHSPVRTPLS